MMEESLFEIFQEVDVEPGRTKREVCERCGRPASVCLCCFLPTMRISLRSTILHILQHPNEENRPLHTVAILRAALSSESCRIYKGQRFNETSFPMLHQVLRQGDTYLLYPNESAKELSEIVKTESSDRKYNLFLIDGTWKQASSIYAQNKFLHSMPKIQLRPNHTSEYVIRTQPTEKSLSTVECAALALEGTEADPNIKEVLLKPLRGLCQFQLDCGACVHQSKEFIANEASTR